MDVVIKTGFEKITHDIVFNPSTVPRGKNLAAAGHVQFVEEHRKDGISEYIQATVIRTTSVTYPAYTVKLYVSSIHMFQAFCLCSIK